MKHARHPDWKMLLDEYVRKHETVPFDWRSHNCVTFAAEWLRLATGVTLEVPRTQGVRDALRAVDAAGGLYAAACRQLGEPVPGLFAQPGDLVLLNLPRSCGRVLRVSGVCLGSVVAAQGPNGLVMVPITEAEAAWRV